MDCMPAMSSSICTPEYHRITRKLSNTVCSVSPQAPPMPEILSACLDAGAAWVVVEQDEPSMGLSRMESIKASREYLASQGW